MKASKNCQSKQKKIALKRQHIEITLQDQTNHNSKPSKKIKTEVEITENSKMNSNFYETIEEVPYVQLTKIQMNSDPLALIQELEAKYNQYGAVKLIVNDSWNSPFTFRYIDRKVTTRIQHLSQLKQGKPFEQKIEKYTVKQFQTLAREYDRTYAFKTDVVGKSMESKLQMQYWNLVSNKKYQKSQKAVSVQYAADLASSKYGSGFPTRKVSNWLDADFEYETNLFNLNNIYKSPSSLLAMTEARKQRISGLNLPWVYMGMKFSTFCWHVEDLWINSINFNHKGGVKNWYIIPPKYKEKFDQYVKKHYCETNLQKKNLLNRITFMVDPRDLIENGIKVYKIYQRPREFVCTFFKSYHCGFSHSFNIGEAVNFFTPNSLDFIKQSLIFERKSDNNKPPVIPFAWLVVQNLANAERFGHNGCIKIKAYFQQVLEQQFNQLQFIVKKHKKDMRIQQVEIIDPKVKYQKNYCSDCKSYEYLSSIKCKNCNKNRCYKHFRICCNGQFVLLVRKINKLMQKLGLLVPALNEQVVKGYKNKQALSDLNNQNCPIKQSTWRSAKK